MDWIRDRGRILEYIKKYRLVLLIFLLGLIFMLLPEPKKEEVPEAYIMEEAEPELQDHLAAILSKIAGAGKVEVLLTQSAGEQTLYQMNEDISASDARRETVLITNSQREETGLIRQVNPPVYQGAIILCQGADSANIRLSIVEAVMSVTGLSSDRITVLKMK